MAVIGSGFAGLSTATFLAHQGHEVTVFEKNSTAGGRARSFSENGFTFDMGPSWYWMPDIFERYFGLFGKKVEDYYNLIRLDPSYRIFFPDDEVDIPAGKQELYDLFESLEAGSAKKLEKFLKEAEFKYNIGINNLVHKPSLSPFEFINSEVISGVFRMQVFSSIGSHIHKNFKHPKLRSILEFPCLFLGGTPENTPALYSLMNYADLHLGTWYPMGGMVKIVEGMEKLAVEQGVSFKFDSPVKELVVDKDEISGVRINKELEEADFVVSGADYHHTETQLLDSSHRSYSEKFWNRQVMAPSALIYYLGIDKKVDGLLHHNLFFDEDFKDHAKELYDNPRWPSKPLFYACAPSKTDPHVAPEGKENIFILVPVAPGLKDSKEIRDKYLEVILDRMENRTSSNIRDHIVYKKSFSINDFKSEYNSFKGNAYGLANTLRQTAFLKPRIKSKKVKNLYYTGQLTVPGPGVPPALISGEVVANYVNKIYDV